MTTVQTNIGLNRPLTSRRVAAILAGWAYLVAVLTLDAWISLTLSVAAVSLIAALKLARPRAIALLSTDATRHRWAEVIFPAAGTLSLAAGWVLLGDRWLAFIPIAFMAW